jgi:hypothetical protein
MRNLPHPIQVVTFEDYGPINARAGKIAQRAEMCGVLKSFFLQQMRLPLFLVKPNALKTFATGKGNSKKDAMMQAAAAGGYFAVCSDDADAYHAAMLGKTLILGNKCGVAYERVNP